MFIDLRICSLDENIVSEIIKKSSDFGFSVLAIDVVVRLEDKPKNEFILQKKLIDNLKDEAEKYGIKLLKRATFITGEIFDKHLSIIKEIKTTVDIIAVIPTTQIALRAASHCNIIDLISFDQSSFPLLKPGSEVDIAISAGIFIEISYGSAISGNNNFNTFFFGHVMYLLRRCRHQKFILSSGAYNTSHLRGHFDLLNLAIMMGMGSKAAHAAVNKNPQSVITHAYTRNSTICGTFEIQHLLDDKEPQAPCVSTKRTHVDQSLQPQKKRII